jgi:threonine aldolase
MFIDPTFKAQFASDNTAGACPEALQAMVQANDGFALPYGNDDCTHDVCDHLREIFQTDCDVFFVLNGTAANSLALAALCQSYQSIICADVAHIETDECGAPEFFSNGAKLLLSPSHGGKLTPEGVTALVRKRQDIHYPRPHVVSITQSTEVGTVYSLDEVAALGEAARRNGLRLHMDGARFANALASLSCSPADLTWRRGVDVLCLGGTKMGLPLGEAILFFDRSLSADFAYRCKQAGQLASKMRFLAAPWMSMLKNQTWLTHARHANAMAQRLSAGMQQIPGVRLSMPVDANAVFAHLPDPMRSGLRQAGWQFYDFIGASSRFMCSWACTPDAVDALLADMRQVAEGSA